MAYVRWKMINGHGPYAYLEESVKEGEKVTSRHIACLGATGSGGLAPGSTVNLSAHGRDGTVTVPEIPAGLGATTAQPGSASTPTEPPALVRFDGLSEDSVYNRDRRGRRTYYRKAPDKRILRALPSPVSQSLIDSLGYFPPGRQGELYDVREVAAALSRMDPADAARLRFRDASGAEAPESSWAALDQIDELATLEF